jgi:hypothetical protein
MVTALTTPVASIPAAELAAAVKLAFETLVALVSDKAAPPRERRMAATAILRLAKPALQFTPPPPPLQAQGVIAGSRDVERGSASDTPGRDAQITSSLSLSDPQPEVRLVAPGSASHGLPRDGQWPTRSGPSRTQVRRQRPESAAASADGLRSGTNSACSGSPSATAAAAYPLRVAPSMVAGQPVLV